MKIYLIRHSESEDDINGSYGGCADWKLTENGREKVENFRVISKHLGIQKFFSSPYKRAYETARILNKDYDVKIERVAPLREINTYGVMSGVNKELAKELFSCYLNSPEYKNIGYYNQKSFYGGEDVSDFDLRVMSAWKYISEQPEDIVAVVTHGGVFRSTFKNVLNKDRIITHIDDVACVEIEYTNNKFIVKNTTGVYFK